PDKTAAGKTPCRFLTVFAPALMRDFVQVRAGYSDDDQILFGALFLRGRLTQQLVLIGANRDHALSVDDHELTSVLSYLRRLLCPAKIFERLLLDAGGF